MSSDLVLSNIENFHNENKDSSEAQTIFQKYATQQYAPVITEDTQTPVISFSNLTIEYVAANVIESAATNTLSLLRHYGGYGNAAVKSKKIVLKRVSGEITSGLWGILGLSGSGKVPITTKIGLK